MSQQEQEHHDEGQISLQFIKDLLPFAMLIVSGLVWGMKLEARYDKIELEVRAVQKDMASVQTDIDRGILPIAAEKIIQLNDRIAKVERDCVDRGVKTDR